ncbi:carbonic anhydrase [Thermoproteus uzoniensis 768-20]|uniref:carbonic anhydrase n=1 Tax=Thermoproteus uzoniensis (strain 768-20) TaxID=999630 RepID=F2L6D1_THEU7|nr:carbonic anhydrase [Thermoproteus uzoniensis]AEA12527.1 carbonic anhydrase [Thermoproteus uzoniensis 768-20]
MCLEGFAKVRAGVGALSAAEILRQIRETAAAQRPRCAVLTCSDSRVSPELLTLSGVGEMFVVRVAGNVVDDLVYHSLKFAVDRLGVRTIYVVGHKRCGAVALGLDGAAPPPIQRQIDEAVKRAGSREPEAVEVENVRVSCEKLRDIGARVEGYYYDIDAVELKRVC